MEPEGETLRARSAEPGGEGVFPGLGYQCMPSGSAAWGGSSAGGSSLQTQLLGSEKGLGS